MVRLQSLMSNQSDDVKAIRNSTSAQVQVLKSIAQWSRICNFICSIYVQDISSVPYGCYVGYLWIKTHLTSTYANK